VICWVFRVFLTIHLYQSFISAFINYASQLNVCLFLLFSFITHTMGWRWTMVTTVADYDETFDIPDRGWVSMVASDNMVSTEPRELKRFLKPVIQLQLQLPLMEGVLKELYKQIILDHQLIFKN
ncbi:hypothetical protein M8C21_010139, partial [Ambrosia artemisiifolia]